MWDSALAVRTHDLPTWALDVASNISGRNIVLDAGTACRSASYDPAAGALSRLKNMGSTRYRLSASSRISSSKKLGSASHAAASSGNPSTQDVGRVNIFEAEPPNRCRLEITKDVLVFRAFYWQ